MTTEEILKQATPRPWKMMRRANQIGLCGCILTDKDNRLILHVPPEKASVTELIVLAVNAYESDQRKIAVLTRVLHSLAMHVLQSNLYARDEVRSLCADALELTQEESLKQ